ncbi:hypothetical protein [Flavobacterium ovatum]|uniref:hypothetical protein n=1 Tax=Flavobacterium ovatum TaxID=1928857 RepID=UPI00344D0BB0
MEINLIKKIITPLFDFTFINFHFKKKCSIEESKSTTYNNISLLILFFLFITLSVFFAVISLGIFKLKVTRLSLYLCLMPVALVLYFNKNLIQEYIIKPNVDFSMAKYTDEYVKDNNKRGFYILVLIGLFGALSYIIMRLGSWYLYHL